MIKVYTKVFDSETNPCLWTPEKGEWQRVILFPTTAFLFDEQGGNTLIPYTSLDSISFDKEDDVILALENG